jgi:hypothetical protein
VASPVPLEDRGCMPIMLCQGVGQEEKMEMQCLLSGMGSSTEEGQLRS